MKPSTKMKPFRGLTPALISKLHQIRHQCRIDNGGGGACHLVSEQIQADYGWRRISGTYTSRDYREPVVVGHLWNLLPDGSILDATADQLGEGHDVRVVRPDNPEYHRYRPEFDIDTAPDRPGYDEFLARDYPHLDRSTVHHGGDDLTWAQRIDQERGRDWWRTDREQLARYREDQRQYGLEEARRHLPLAKNAASVAKSSLASVVVIMDPADFLKLTEHPADEPINTSASVEDYRSGTIPEFKLGGHYMPYLNVEFGTGRVRAHEGRHRAAMVRNAGGKKFPVLLYFRSPSLYRVAWREAVWDDEAGDFGEAEPKSQDFADYGQAEEFRSRLEHRERDLHDDLSVTRVTLTNVGYRPLDVPPGSSNYRHGQPNPWNRSHIPPLLIGQFDPSQIVSTDYMQVGVIKRGRPITESNDEERASIVRNMEDEYRLPNLAASMPPDQLHPIVKLGRPRVTIYRAVPEGVAEIRPGDWVALTKDYAASHGRGHVISMRVPADHVAWAGTDQNEYYYVPRNLAEGYTAGGYSAHAWQRWWGNVEDGTVLPVRVGDHDQFFFENVSDFFTPEEMAELPDPDDSDFEPGDQERADGVWSARDLWLVAAYRKGWVAVLYDGNNRSLSMRTWKESPDLRGVGKVVGTVMETAPVERLILEVNGRDVTVVGAALERFVRTGRLSSARRP